jgi:hypothetical protein
MGWKATRYRNAAAVLPKDLLAQVQEYLGGTTVYVPKPVKRKEVHRLLVLDLRMQGYTLVQIAYRTGLSRRGVMKILQRDRERAQALLRLVNEGQYAYPGNTTVGSETGETTPSLEKPDAMTEEER